MKTIIIIEDNETLLQWYKEVIAASKHFKVLDTFYTFEDALVFCKTTTPDIALVDINLPGMRGIEGIQKLVLFKPSIKCIIISVFDRSEYIFEALSAGAIGYLTKNCTNETLLNAIEEAINGGAPMSSHIAKKVVSFFKTPKEESLSERENDVLKILSKGKSYATIAQELNLSINTIKTHVRNIYEKLHINNKKELIEKYGK